MRDEMKRTMFELFGVGSEDDKVLAAGSVSGRRSGRRGRVARPARAGCHRRREGQSGQRVRVHPTVPHRHPPPAL